MLPPSTSSSRLMARSRVLLPEPEGPMMTTFSPGATERETSSRARSAPKRFTTPCMRMMGSAAFATAEPVLHRAHPLGKEEGDDQVDEGDEGVGLEVGEALGGELPPP